MTTNLVNHYTIQSEIYDALSKTTPSLMDGYVRKYLDNDILAVKQIINTIYGLGGDNMKIKKVIFNDPATIILWDDGSKTIVKCMEGDTYDPEKGLAMAISKKFLGDDFRKTFKKYMEQYEDQHSVFESLNKHASSIGKTEEWEPKDSEPDIPFAKTHSGIPVCPHCGRVVHIKHGYPNTLYCQFCGKKYKRP